MSYINGQYLYNLATGETIGVKKGNNTSGANTNGQSVTYTDGHYFWEDFYIIGDNSIDGIQYGTIEDLSFEKTLELFLQGNLTIEELEIGLRAKNVSGFTYSTTENTVDVQFLYQDKLYNLSCSKDAAATQIDDKIVENYQDNIIIDDRYREFIEKGAKAFVLTYFNFDPPTFNRFSELTNEQVKFVNSHPEIFHMTIDERPPHDVLSYDDYISEVPYGQGKTYTYEAGAYDMFGNGNPTGPNGSIPVGVDGMYVKPDTLNGEKGFYLYLYDSSKGEYVKNWHRYDLTMGSVIMALKHGHMNWSDPKEGNGDRGSFMSAMTNITLYGYGMNESELYCCLLFGYNQTDRDGIVEKDGKYYKFNQDGKNFLGIIDESKVFTEISIEGDITVYKNNPPSTNDYGAQTETLKASINNPDYSPKLYPTLCVDSFDDNNVVLGDKFIKGIFDYLHNIFNLIQDELVNNEDNYLTIFQKYLDQDPLLKALFSEDYSGIFDTFQRIADATNLNGSGYTSPELRNRIFDLFVAPSCYPEDAYESYISGGPWTVPLDSYLYILLNLGLLPEDFANDSANNSVHAKLEGEIEADQKLLELFNTEIDLENNPPALVNTIEEVDELAKKLGLQKDEKGFYWSSGHAGTTGPRCFTWNPITQRFEKVEAVVSGTEETYFDPSDYYDTQNKFPGKWMLQKMSMAAVRQNLNFTSDPRVCIDNDNNYWVYDSENDVFIKQDNVKPTQNVEEGGNNPTLAPTLKPEEETTEPSSAPAILSKPSIIKRKTIVDGAISGIAGMVPKPQSLHSVADDVKVVPTEKSALDKDEPEELMSSEDYKHEANDNLEELQSKVGNIISDNGIYYSVFNGKRYNYVWDPFEHKWLTFASDDIKNGRPKDKTNLTLVRVQLILAALKAGLIFTTNPNICKDRDGNFYDFNEASGTFQKRVK